MTVVLTLVLTLVLTFVLTFVLTSVVLFALVIWLLGVILETKKFLVLLWSPVGHVVNGPGGVIITIFFIMLLDLLEVLSMDLHSEQVLLFGTV